MRELSITPSITVTIGRHTRLYFASVTTASAALDSPSGERKDNTMRDEMPQRGRDAIVEAVVETAFHKLKTKTA